MGTAYIARPYAGRQSIHGVIGLPDEISVPILAVKAIYAQENGKGMVFPEGEGETKGSGPPLPPHPPQPRKPRLRLVK